MTVINTNIKALYAQAAMNSSNQSMTVAMQQLSTGLRINSARDDAAGLAIVTRMTEQIGSMNQAVSNANDAVNLIQTAEGATSEITDMMQRMRELAVEAANDTNSDADRSDLDLEFQQLKEQIVQISDNTEWNGFSVLNGTAGQQVGQMPVYKTTSDPASGSVFIQPTTSKTLSGADAGEIQQFTLGGTPSDGTFSVAGVTVPITDSQNTLSAAADQIVTTLNNSTTFSAQGITASDSVPSVVQTTGSGTTATLPTNGTTVVTLKNMTAGQTVTVNGATFTAATSISAADVATILQGGSATAAQGTLTGSVTGSPTLQSPSDGTLTFTASGSSTTAPTVNVSGSVTLNYSASNGEAAPAAILTGSTGMTIDGGSTSATSTTADITRKAVTTAVENFSNSGEFLQSGSLQMSIPSGAVANGVNSVTATFTNADNQQIQMTGTLSSTNPATVTFKAADGLNSSVISSDLTYTFQSSDGTNVDLSAATGTPRALSMTVGVEGSIPTTKAGDLIINGVNVGATQASDDTVSPLNNAAGSAIALAAAINRVAVDQGVSQGKTEAITFSGTPSAGTITVGGVSVTLTSDDNTPALAAAKIAAALSGSSAFDTSSTGRSVSYASGSATISISYPASEGDVAPVDVEAGSTGLGDVVNTTQAYATTTAGTGVYAKVNANIVSGQAMVAGKVETGVVYINGYASANIQTVYNNPQATRANVVRAINMISDKTGVKAIDTGSDSKGIQLVAADGRNIEVSFQTTGSSTNASFGQRIGLAQGVQRSTISLESKIDTPIVLSSSASGNIANTGLTAGDYAKNQSVLNTSARAPVSAAVAQVSSIAISGATSGGNIATGQTVSAVINGTTFAVTVGSSAVAENDTTHTVSITSGNPQDIRNALMTLVNNDSTLGVYASQGSTTNQLQLTARSPGTAFTMTASTSDTTTGVAVTASQITANQAADTSSLGSNDLVINGVSIAQATAADDTVSYTGVSSSSASASAVALAAAINKSSAITGVKATANSAEIDGSNTTTDTPVSGVQSLWVNGVQIQVNFTQNESAAARRANVITAINQVTGECGVQASDNGQGVTLKTVDGRNLSVWFDSSQKDLKASDFGLDQGGSVAQVSKVQISGAASAGTVSVMINGVTIATPVTASMTANATSTALAAAINANTSLSNVTASIDTNGNLLITSNVPGSSFDLRAATVSPSSSSQTMSLSTVTLNSQGNNQVSAVNMSTAYATNVLGSANAPVSAYNITTVYGSVKLVADAPNLPSTPNADGISASTLNSSGNPIQISAGTNGFGSLSNFSSLGFSEGSFGGRSSEDMDPPRVGRLTFQVGSDANQVVTIDLADFGKDGDITGAITGDVDLDTDKRTVRINTQAGATAVLNLLDDAMNKIDAARATMGAVMNRLDDVVSNLTNVTTNMTASRSTIEDVDYGQASTDLARAQILQQAATAVLAQANTSQQSVLKLLGS